MSPELRIYNQPNIVTSEADIKTTLMKDKFIVINLVQNQEYFNVRYQDKPLMLWIWVSVLLLSMGGILSFFKKRIFQFFPVSSLTAKNMLARQKYLIQINFIY